jgi:hypothetical protein
MMDMGIEATVKRTYGNKTLDGALLLTFSLQ